MTLSLSDKEQWRRTMLSKAHIALRVLHFIFESAYFNRFFKRVLR
jgi:hypothetical protein